MLMLSDMLHIVCDTSIRYIHCTTIIDLKQTNPHKVALNFETA